MSNIGILFISILGGLLPALVWLFFWLREDSKHPEPKWRLTSTFIAGIAIVIIVLPLEQWTFNIAGGLTTSTLIIWAAIEEISKFVAVYFIALKSRANDEPIDAMIYLITIALGFSAAENSLFILTPLLEGNVWDGIIIGNLRFLGASLLHVTSSALIGAFMAISFYKSDVAKRVYVLIGIVVAIALHSLFNFFIIKDGGAYAFATFGAVWLAIIGLIIFFEKVKKIRN